MMIIIIASDVRFWVIGSNILHCKAVAQTLPSHAEATIGHDTKPTPPIHCGHFDLIQLLPGTCTSMDQLRSFDDSSMRCSSMHIVCGSHCLCIYSLETNLRIKRSCVSNGQAC